MAETRDIRSEFSRAPITIGSCGSEPVCLTLHPHYFDSVQFITPPPSTLLNPIWVWLKIKQEGLHWFWSMLPRTRVPFWYRLFEPQPFFGSDMYVSTSGPRRFSGRPTIARSRTRRPPAANRIRAELSESKQLGPGLFGS